MALEQQRRSRRPIGSIRRSATRGSRPRPARSSRRSTPTCSATTSCSRRPSFLIPTPTRTDVVTSNVGLSQRLPWFGTSYSVSWDTSHTNSNSFLNSYNPLLQSGLSLNVSQPLLRDLSTDAPRVQLATEPEQPDIADTRLRESVVHTTAAVKTAYWNLVSARANVDARRTALQLAEELARVNKAKVDVGQSPPLDLLSAQAEVAANQEQLIVAETAVKQAEDRLRAADLRRHAPRHLDRPARTDRFAAGRHRGARRRRRGHHRAARSRRPAPRAQGHRQRAHDRAKFTGNQRLPDVRANASYQASGLGGTEVLRSRRFPGTIVGPGTDHAVRIGARSAVQERLPDVGGRRQRLVSDRRQHRGGELRADAARSGAGASSA